MSSYTYQKFHLEASGVPDLWLWVVPPIWPPSNRPGPACICTDEEFRERMYVQTEQFCEAVGTLIGLHQTRLMASLSAADTAMTSLPPADDVTPRHVVWCLLFTDRVSTGGNAIASVRFHSNFWAEWPLTVTLCVLMMGYDHSSPEIKGQGQRSSLGLELGSQFETPSVAGTVRPRSSIEDSFLVSWVVAVYFVT